MVSSATLRAAFDGKNVYILAVWDDLTGSASLAKDEWQFDGTDWSRPSGRNEDRIALMFNINATDWRGCAAFCHVDEGHEHEGEEHAGRMRTNNEGETVDMWHWKSARSNPMGFADDKHMIWADGQDDPESATRIGDDGSSPDSSNASDDGTLPEWMAHDDPGASATHIVALPEGGVRAVSFSAHGSDDGDHDDGGHDDGH